MHPEIEHAVYILLKMQTVKEFIYTPDPSDHWNFVSAVKETSKSAYM